MKFTRCDNCGLKEEIKQDLSFPKEGDKKPIMWINATMLVKRGFNEPEYETFNFCGGKCCKSFLNKSEPIE